MSSPPAFFLHTGESHVKLDVARADLGAICDAIATVLPTLAPKQWGQQLQILAVQPQREPVPLRSEDDVAALLRSSQVPWVLHLHAVNDQSESKRDMIPPSSFQIGIVEKTKGFAIKAACCWKPEPVQADALTTASSSASTASTGDSKMDVTPDVPLIDFEAIERLDVDAISSFAHSLKSYGYVRLQLPLAVFERVNAFQKQTAARFFAQKAEAKSQVLLAKTGSHRYGYFDRSDMGKELFQVRLTDEKDPWPSEPSDFRSGAQDVFWAMHRVGVSCMRALCAFAHGGAEKDCSSQRRAQLGRRWADLCDGITPQDNPLASSLLDVFNYFAQPRSKDLETCGVHTDYGLLTLIPSQSGVSGLEVYNWTSGNWDALEKQNASTRQCVVFAGESLQHLSCQHFLASPHKVVLKDTSVARLSTPFLLFANPSKELDPRGLSEAALGKHVRIEESKGKGKGKEDARFQPQRALDLVLGIVARTPSVTFDKLYNKQEEKQKQQQERKVERKDDVSSKAAAGEAKGTAAGSGSGSAGSAGSAAGTSRQDPAILKLLTPGAM